ncbi:MAG: hypothetical protein Tsb0014_04900 [Pleurocapsa sp.]
MVDVDIKSQWHFRGRSIQGASHIHKEIVNQDAINSESEEGFPLILAIADGHGSAKSFRSHLGSKLAVETATEEFKDFYQKCQSNSQKLDFIQDSITTELSKDLVNKWRQKVDEYINENPFTEEEWTKLIAKDGETAKAAVEQNPYLAYGATLLTVLVTESFIVYFQLGDGDIICVDSQGNISRPIPPDERLIANETTSLCREKAWEDVRLKVQEISLDSLSELPEIILVSTDGYANSFSTESDFIQVGKDYLQMIQEQGLNKIAEDLPEFLNYSSENGSGDDITLGIIERILPKNSNHTNEISQEYLEEEKKNEDNMNIQEKLTNDIEPQLQKIAQQQQKVIEQNTFWRNIIYVLIIFNFFLLLSNILKPLLDSFFAKPKNKNQATMVNELSPKKNNNSEQKAEEKENIEFENKDLEQALYVVSKCQHIKNFNLEQSDNWTDFLKNLEECSKDLDVKTNLNKL